LDPGARYIDRVNAGPDDCSHCSGDFSYGAVGESYGAAGK